MITVVFHKFRFVLVTHWNNNLLFKWALYNHIQFGFELIGIFDNFLNIFYFIHLEIWEDLLDFENFFGIGNVVFGCLGI